MKITYISISLKFKDEEYELQGIMECSMEIYEDVFLDKF